MESSADKFSQRMRDDESIQKFYIVTNDDGQMCENVQKAFEVSFTKLEMRSRQFILYFLR